MYIHNITCHTASFLVTNAKYLTKETSRKERTFARKTTLKFLKSEKLLQNKIFHFRTIAKQETKRKYPSNISYY